MAYRTENPATGVIEKEFTSATDADVTRAIERADAAFSTWRTTEAAERAAALAKIADLYDERADELAGVIGTEMGKPLAQAQGEVALASSIFRWYASHGEDLLAEEQLSIGDDAKSVVVTDPIGVLMGVMPWNFPHYQVARFVAPNLMLGNTILLKHASICARTAELIEEILHAAGVPQDAYINLFVSNEQITSIIEDPRVRGVSLTGSEGAGKAVAETAAQNLKKSVLELGGSDALIVLDDVDVAETAETVATARMSNAGQACNSPKRILVPSAMFDEFVTGVVETVDTMTVGDPANESTDMGPLSSIEARDDAIAQVERAVEQGATRHTGGKALERDGAWMSPAVLTGVTREMDAFTEEIFGPVAVVYPYDSIEEAVEIANDSSFGLSGSVWSKDTTKAEQVARRLEVGMTYVNEHGTTKAGLPFGGVRRSGYGRELGRWGFGEFANTKLVRVAK
ncbi:aldehyde dehydrogenase [Janibacter hoylei PVAS-1]|uniref:Aldehyde dehydrogenase n=1 Tax=Janibacter hoylei PVAS-1 TaxID=1210046 RepID=K1EKH3_9MICO|nr:NAD-dependent succinate-semialdehyde dehydrogenase [Janibacter hoylei]EKA59823.1 aldehyde dehydrogenase [Janibacter hoylei PVAS-1]RWU84869.1 NAD-dependent succinate-semialdehyde dehydrogenase [Janibacter hoylei PVAS-1]